MCFLAYRSITGSLPLSKTPILPSMPSIASYASTCSIYGSFSRWALYKPFAGNAPIPLVFVNFRNAHSHQDRTLVNPKGLRFDGCGCRTSTPNPNDTSLNLRNPKPLNPKPKPSDLTSEVGITGNCSRGLVMNEGIAYPRAPSYLNSRLLGYLTIGYIEPRTQYLGNWSPRVIRKKTCLKKVPLEELAPRKQVGAHIYWGRWLVLFRLTPKPQTLRPRPLNGLHSKSLNP